MTITKHGRRSWRVYDDDGSLVCVACYRKGAREVVRRLNVARSEDAADPEEVKAPEKDVREKDVREMSSAPSASDKKGDG